MLLPQGVERFLPNALCQKVAYHKASEACESFCAHRVYLQPFGISPPQVCQLPCHLHQGQRV